MRTLPSRFAFIVAMVAAVALSQPGLGGRRPAATSAQIEDVNRVALRLERVSRSVDAARERQVRPAVGPITGTFGERRGGHRHSGIDINGETGDPVSALVFGTIVYAGPAVKGYTGYGQMVRIDHGGFETVYAHLSRIDVHVGDLVRGGDVVGAIGTSGHVTGSHLHFEVRIGGKPVDPAPYVDFV